MPIWHGSYGNSKGKGNSTAKSNTRFKEDWICGLCTGANWASNWRCGNCKVDKGRCKPTRWTAWKDVGVGASPTYSKAQRDQEEREAATLKELAVLRESLRKLKEGVGLNEEDSNPNAGKGRINEINKEAAAIIQKEKDLDAVPESMRVELCVESARKNLRMQRDVLVGSKKEHRTCEDQEVCADNHEVKMQKYLDEATKEGARLDEAFAKIQEEQFKQQ